MCAPFRPLLRRRNSAALLLLAAKLAIAPLLAADLSAPARLKSHETLSLFSARATRGRPQKTRASGASPWKHPATSTKRILCNRGIMANFTPDSRSAAESRREDWISHRDTKARRHEDTKNGGLGPRATCRCSFSGRDDVGGHHRAALEALHMSARGNAPGGGGVGVI